MYDYYLGGTAGTEADREAAARVQAEYPILKSMVRANRSFLRRCVRFMVDQGITQLLDIGSGFPTTENTHQVARTAMMDVDKDVRDLKVVYVDFDENVVRKSCALLEREKMQMDGNNIGEIIAIHGDVRDIPRVHKAAKQILNFERPIGVMMIGLLYLCTDGEVKKLLGDVYSVLKPGSFVALSHVCKLDKLKRLEQMYEAQGTFMKFREVPEVEHYFDRFALVDPGFVELDAWRPDAHTFKGEQEGTLFGGIGQKR